MEDPLNFKVRDRIERFEPAWRKAIAFPLQVAGADVTAQDVVVNWLNVQTIQPEVSDRIRLMDIQAGIPLEVSLKREGWMQAEIDDLREARQASSDSLGEQLLTAFDRGQ